jgi:hypothetical protein
MSSTEPTARDRIWAAIITRDSRFRVSDIREAINSNDRPSDETIRRVLRAGAELGVIDHYPNSPYYSLATNLMTGVPNLSTEEISDRDFLNPKGIDVTEFIDQFRDERTEDGIYSDNIMDILNDERIMRAQTNPHHYPFRPAPSVRERDQKRRVWKSAFLMLYGDADTIEIIDTSTGRPVDLSEHLEMDFDQGTKRLDLGTLKETQLFDDILNDLYRTHRPGLDYREIAAVDDQEIEEHVRTEVRSFTAEAGTVEWDTHVEALVDEVVEMFDPTDPREQSVLSEWVRSIAREEADD